MNNSEYLDKAISDLENLCKGVIERYQNRFGAFFLDRHIFRHQLNNLSSWNFVDPKMVGAVYEDEDFRTFDRYYKNLLKVTEEERLVKSYIANHLIEDLKKFSDDEKSSFAKVFKLGMFYADLSIFEESKATNDENDFFERAVRHAISNNMEASNSVLAISLTTPDFFEEIQTAIYGKIIYLVDHSKSNPGTVIFYYKSENESESYSRYYRTIETMVSRVRQHISKHKLDPYNSVI